MSKQICLARIRYVTHRCKPSIMDLSKAANVYEKGIRQTVSVLFEMVERDIDNSKTESQN